MLDSIAERLPVLAPLEADWEPVSQVALLSWISFYAVVLLGLASGGGVARYFDLVFVPIHEGGHLLFGWFGSHWLMVAGGTLLQLFVPFALATYFAFHRQVSGTAFCTFFFFEQLLPVGAYMADSRSQSLTYVTVGDPDLAEHDWNYLFSHAGLLDHDVQIGGAVKLLGIVGMLAVVVWLVWRAWSRRTTGSTSSRVVSGPFGDLGLSLDSAAKSGFWQWFHLEQTHEEKSIQRFQPQGEQFRSLCYMDVAVTPNNQMQGLVLGLQRSFISGSDEPFARDLVRSFLCTVFPQQRAEVIGELVNELGTEFGGSKPVVAAEGAKRAPATGKPSPPYLVFLGRGQRCKVESGTFNVAIENVTADSTPWLCVRVKPLGS